MCLRTWKRQRQKSPNDRDGEDDNAIPLLKSVKRQEVRRIQCNEARDVSGNSKVADSPDSCVFQSHHSAHGQISLAFPLRQLFREMQSLWGAWILVFNKLVRVMS